MVFNGIVSNAEVYRPLSMTMIDLLLVRFMLNYTLATGARLDSRKIVNLVSPNFGTIFAPFVGLSKFNHIKQFSNVFQMGPGLMMKFLQQQKSSKVVSCSQ